MNILHKFALYTSLVLATACTSENELTVPEVPTGGTSAEAPEREVLLTFDNTLKLPQTKAGEDIATEEENRLNSLDIYVFAAEGEGESYSFQQLLYYREDAAQIISQDWAKSFTPMNSDDGKSASAVLKLKKGFLVKLYCIANQTTLRVPDAAAAGGFRVVDINNPGDYFTPLSQSNPGADDNVVTPGRPTLAQFERFTTPLLVATQEADTLFTPLAMVDNSTTALDLRDMTASARLTEGFRLARLAARFDVVNVNKDIKNPDGSIRVKGSNFTITDIYMVKGRPGSSLFPAESCGEVITYPKRRVQERLQTGRVPGCFYLYASPTEDGAYLVLEGLFRINQTETKQVSYPVYFKDANDPSRYLEIQSNHRYTVNITAAEDYELSFNVTEADWTDEGSLDGYEPDNTPVDFAIHIPDALVDQITYDADSKTVSMGREAGNTFTIELKTNSALRVSTSYQGNVENCDWVSISEPVVSPTVTNDRYTNQYTYTVTPNPDYSGTRFPRATLRFMDLATGDEQIIFVKLTGAPVVNELTPAEWPSVIPEASRVNEFDAATQTANLFLMEDSQLPFVITCSDEVEVQNLPDYLEVIELSREGDEVLLALRLTTTQIADIPADGVEITLVNQNRPNLTQTITVMLLDATVEPAFDALGGTNIEHTPGTDGTPDNISIPLVADNEFTISTASVEGVDVNINYNDGSQWLTSRVVPATRATGKDNKTDILFSLVEEKLPGAKPITVTLANKLKGGDYTFTVTPKGDDVPVPVKDANTPSVPVQDEVDVDGNVTMYKLLTTPSTLTLRVAYLGGSKLSCSDPDLVSISPAEITSSNEGTYTLTALKTGTGILTLTSAIDETQSATFSIEVLSPTINIPEGNVSLNLVKDATASKADITSIAGFTADDEDINWGDGGVAWFTLNTTDIEKDGSIEVKTLDLSTLSPDDVKSATVTLKNKLDAPSATFVVDPVWMAPTANTSNASPVNVLCYHQDTITVDVPFGGIANATSTNTAYATVTTNTTTGEIICTGKYFGMNGESQTVNVTVANAKDASKTVTYTINVQNLTWAAGNLVADGSNGCKVGAATDIGLFFRWGSLVGYTSDNASSPTVKPSEYTSSPGFTSSPNLANVDLATTSDVPASGTGDPCRYYLGEKWRMPTSDEYLALGGVTATKTNFTTYLYTSESGVNGIRIPKTGTPYVFFPLSGFLSSSNGVPQNTANGFYWSSSPLNASISWFMGFNSSNANVDNNFGVNYGFPTRCVREP